jgi:molybdate transport system substrate-binding protein
MLAACGPSRPPAEVRVAAAADLQFAFEEVLREFRPAHPPITVSVTYGSSGNFYSQILSQAPYDVYLSADLSYPRKLMEQGLAQPGSEFTYAVGRLALWVPAASALEVGIEALRRPEVRHVAIANPQHAPYGQAAEAALRSLGVYEAVRDKLVYGENVAQALQFVQSGAAEAGLIALSLAVAPRVSGAGRYWEVPLDAFPRLEQGGVILKSARNPDAAQQLRGFITGEQGRAILKRFGFSLPGD